MHPFRSCSVPSLRRIRSPETRTQIDGERGNGKRDEEGFTYAAVFGRHAISFEFGLGIVRAAFPGQIRTGWFEEDMPGPEQKVSRQNDKRKERGDLEG